MIERPARKNTAYSAFNAGVTVHAAIETGWNEELGNVIWNGSTRPLEGEPQKIAGHARDRYVYAPDAGTFHTTLNVGDMVSAGQEVARIGDVPLLANIDGMLRDLTHDGVPIAQKAKGSRKNKFTFWRERRTGRF